MSTKSTLKSLDLNPGNSVVIGSGILQAMGIRQSHDIDLVVTPGIYHSLKNSGKFSVTQNHGLEILAGDELEIGTDWFVLGKSYTYSDFLPDSVVIDDVRYITLDFLLRVKKSWLLHDATVRQKDIDDVKLMEDYLKR